MLDKPRIDAWNLFIIPSENAIFLKKSIISFNIFKGTEQSAPIRTFSNRSDFA